MIKISQKGDFSKSYKFLNSMEKKDFYNVIEKYAIEGVNALANATPVDTGLTASSWTYKINKTRNGVTISWNNTNIQNGVSIAIILQYGHGTKNGGFVQGIDYINPTIKPIFEKIEKAVVREVIR